ncbi:MAG: hypothetical protein KDJ65_38995, partial [Anaerolineae bacterium]|nr:hypothetical protein [Anaerolineae bacterium]
DLDAVENIARRLQEQAGFALFMSPQVGELNPTWHDSREEAFFLSRTCLFLVGPLGLKKKKRTDTFFQLIRKRLIDDVDFQFIPILLPGSAPSVMEQFPNGLDQLVWVDFRVNLQDNRAFYQLVQQINNVNEETIEIPTDYGNPYRGLSAFGEEDARFFFGRETSTNKLIHTVEQTNFVVVTGPSGSGKSSIVFAGLVPQLRTKREWLITSFRPGSKPFDSLAQAIAPLTQLSDQPLDNPQQIQEVTHLLEQDRTYSIKLIDSIIDKRPSIKSILIIVDQFEELYTLCPYEDIRQNFIDLLLFLINPSLSDHNNKNSLSPAKPPVTILLTLRADFLGKALAYRPLADAIQPGIKLIGAMSPNELALAIEYPAQMLGRNFEKGLVKQILSDVGDEPGRLPLLEFMLTELWERQRGGWLTVEAYQQIGGIEGALTHFADSIYMGLTTEQKQQARRIFTQLVQPGVGMDDTRRIASRVELEADWPLVQQLADSRLVVTDRNTAGDEVVEVVHETLIQHWVRLRKWIGTDRTFRAWQERLRAAIHQWQDTAQDEGGLLRGAPLAEAEEWLAQRKTDLSTVERDFILRSINLWEQQAAQIEADRQHQLRQAQERAEEQTQAANQLRRRAIWLGTALVLLLLAIITAIGFGMSAQSNLQTAQVRATEVAANLATANHLATQERLARSEADANLATSEYRA